MSGLKVELISATPNPIEFLFATEKYAKTDSGNPFLTDPKTIAKMRWLMESPGYVFHPESLHQGWWEDFAEACDILNIDTEPGLYVEVVEQWALKVMFASIPISAGPQFSFQISGATIAWREQLVRHQVGSTYWIQSGRITDYSTFYDRGGYNNPYGKTPKPLDPAKNTVVIRNPNDGMGDTSVSFQTDADAFEYIMELEQQFFAMLKANGSSDEDAREIIGNGVHHRLTWNVNLRSLIGIIKHRTCWIAQSHWSPIVVAIMNELIDIDPLFRVIGQPPCVTNGEFTECKYEGMAQERYDGDDPLPVCPIWYAQRSKPQFKLAGTKTGRLDSSKTNLSNVPPMKTRDELRDENNWDDARIEVYGKMWGRKWVEESDQVEDQTAS